VAGWWYVRNWQMLGDPLGWGAMLLSTGSMLRKAPLSFGMAVRALLDSGPTGLAVFGWTNLPVHPAFYWLALGVCALGLVGLIKRLVTARRLSIQLEYCLLFVWPLAFFVSLARWVEVNTAANQWRLLFPAYPALALLMALGLYQLTGSRWKPLLALPVGLFGLNIGALALLIAPAYATPEPYAGPIQHPLNVRFGDSIRLIGYSMPQPPAAHVGDSVEVDLFWKTLAPVAKDYVTELAAFDAQSQRTWDESSSPDEGRAPMIGWQPGQIVRDQHRIRVRAGMDGAQSLLLSVYDPAPPGAHQAAFGADSARLTNDVAGITRFLVLPGSVRSPAVGDGAAFDDHLRLEGHSVRQSGGQLTVTLDWSAAGGQPSRDYTVFVHLVAPDGQQVAQQDGQPGGGEFPTSLLPANTEIADSHVLSVAGLSAGDYRLEVGLYDLDTGARLVTTGGANSVSLPVTLSAS
ncbi:MAG TPA: hypothetical protein VKU60_02945, partial [Chloroflexota bacterium]|nr:hypothetical protein [Chloroflexota bacterium]